MYASLGGPVVVPTFWMCVCFSEVLLQNMARVQFGSYLSCKVESGGLPELMRR